LHLKCKFSLFYLFFLMSTKSLLQNTILYSFSGLILRASSIFLFPIFSYYLKASDYGIISITGSLTLIISSIAMLEIPRAITRYIYVQENNKHQNDQYISTAFITILSIHLVLSLLLIFLGKFLLKPLLNDIPFFPYMFIAILALPFTALFDFYKQLKKSEQNGYTAFKAEMLYYGGNIFFNLLFVVVFKMDAMGIILSTLVVAILFSLYFFFFEKKIYTSGFSWPLLKNLLHYSMPILIFILFGLLMESTDRLFLNYKTNTTSSGIYYIALTFASIFSILKESVNSSFTPWFYEYYEKKRYRELEKIFKSILIGMTILSVSLTWFSYEILYILTSNRDLLAATSYIPYALISLYLVFIGQTFNLFVFYEISKTKHLIWSNLAGFLINLLFCYLLVPVYLEKGAILSRLAAFFIMSSIQIVIGMHFSKIKIRYSFISLLLLLNILFSSILFLPIPYLYLIIFKIVTTIIMLILFYLYLKKSYSFSIKNIFHLIKS